MINAKSIFQKITAFYEDTTTILKQDNFWREQSEPFKYFYLQRFAIESKNKEREREERDKKKIRKRKRERKKEIKKEKRIYLCLFVFVFIYSFTHLFFFFQKQQFQICWFVHSMKIKLALFSQQIHMQKF